jgi:uncharacterized protein YkwD
MNKAALETLKTSDPALNRFAHAVKQNMDQMTGQTRNSTRMEPLALDATLPEVIARLNEIADRLQ